MYFAADIFYSAMHSRARRKKKEMLQILASAITTYTIRLKTDILPNSQATRSKEKMPTRPQFKQPMMARAHAKMSIFTHHLV